MLGLGLTEGNPPMLALSGGKLLVLGSVVSIVDVASGKVERMYQLPVREDKP